MTNSVTGRTRAVMLASLGLLNSTTYEDPKREEMRRSAVKELNRLLGFPTPGAPPSDRGYYNPGGPATMHRPKALHPRLGG